MRMGGTAASPVERDGGGDRLEKKGRRSGEGGWGGGGGRG